VAAQSPPARESGRNAGTESVKLEQSRRAQGTKLLLAIGALICVASWSGCSRSTSQDLTTERREIQLKSVETIALPWIPKGAMSLVTSESGERFALFGPCAYGNFERSEAVVLVRHGSRAEESEIISRLGVSAEYVVEKVLSRVVVERGTMRKVPLPSSELACSVSEGT